MICEKDTIVHDVGLLGACRCCGARLGEKHRGKPYGQGMVENIQLHPLQHLIVVKGPVHKNDLTPSVGTVITFISGAPIPHQTIPCDGRVYTKSQYPELWAVLGRTYVLYPKETWLQRLVRKWFNLPGPQDGLREDEGRIPDFTSRRKQ